MTRVFICYSRKDSGFVNRLSADLRAAGIPIWRDVDDIPRDIAANTTGWRSSVDRALRESTHMLVVLSPDGVESKEVTAEWNWFVMENRPVYPVLCRACDVPYRLYALQLSDFTSGYESALDGLIGQLLTYKMGEGGAESLAPGQTYRLNTASAGQPATPTVAPHEKTKSPPQMTLLRRWWNVGVSGLACVIVAITASGEGFIDLSHPEYSYVTATTPFGYLSVLVLAILAFADILRARVLRALVFAVAGASWGALTVSTLLAGWIRPPPDLVGLAWLAGISSTVAASLWTLIDALRAKPAQR